MAKSATKDKKSNSKKAPTIKIESPTPTKPKTNKDVLAIDETSQVSTISDRNSQLDSPSKRQRRKPKRFEEYEELDKPKPRASPVKPTPALDAKIQRGKKVVSEVVSSGSASDPDANGTDDEPQQTKKDEPAQTLKGKEQVIEMSTAASTSKVEKDNTGTTNRIVKPKIAPKKKQSAETPKHSLITAYFTKKDSKLETDDSSDLSQDQECIEMNESNSITLGASELAIGVDNELSANLNLPPPLEDSTDASTQEVEHGAADTDPEDDEMPTLTDEKQDNKKRSFDEIRSSHIEEPRPVTTTDTETDSGEPKVQENGDESVAKPARKSSRVSSKARKL